MKILHINTHLTGGAANACLSIYREQLAAGIDASLLVQVREGSTDLPFKRIYETVDSNIQRGFLEFKEVLYKVRRNYLLSKLPSTPIWYSFPWSPYDIINTRLYQEADIIHLHWVGEFLNYRSFFKKNKKPIVWTLHDMNPVTGGQHSEYGFPKAEFSKLCEKMTTYKQNAINKAKITWVAPSKLHAERASKYPIFTQSPCKIIANGVDQSVFKPRSKENLREILGLPSNKKIALFIAYADKYTLKGMSVLREVLREMENEDLLFLSIGNEDFSMFNNCISLGAVSDPLLLAQVYAAADFYVNPSLEESFGLTILESLACGTPVISFATGCTPEVILEGENGFICKEKTAKSMHESINKGLKWNSYKTQKEIDNQVTKYEWKNISSQYLDLYREVLA